MKVLVVEDDQPLASFVRKGLEQEKYVVDLAADGEAANFLANSNHYDLLILDLNLPMRDGLEVLQNVRSNGGDVPVLVLTGRNKVEDRVRCLDLGADDCLIKPFSFLELAARLRALLRRGNTTFEPVLRVDDLEMIRTDHTVRRGGLPVSLTGKEYSLLEYLMQNAGRQLTRGMIIEHVWNMTLDPMTNVVDVYINYLRRKIDDGFETKLIMTVRGVGYQLGKSRTAAV